MNRLHRFCYTKKCYIWKIQHKKGISFFLSKKFRKVAKFDKIVYATLLEENREVSHMARGAGKNGWALVLLILAGVVLGSFISQLASNVSWLSWLSFGQDFGFSDPIRLNLGVLVLTFGLTIKFTIGSILGIIVAAIIYHFI